MVSSLIWLTLASKLWAFYLFALVFGFAYGGLATAHSPLVAWLFGMRKHGLIYGVCFNGWTIGCAVGPIVAGHIFDVTHSYRLAFILCSVVSLMGLLLTLLLKPAFLQKELEDGNASPLPPRSEKADAQTTLTRSQFVDDFS